MVIQQGQVFKLKARCADGEPLWAYRYRIAGRGSARRQVQLEPARVPTACGTILDSLTARAYTRPNDTHLQRLPHPVVRPTNTAASDDAAYEH